MTTDEFVCHVQPNTGSVRAGYGLGNGTGRCSDSGYGGYCSDFNYGCGSGSGAGGGDGFCSGSGAGFCSGYGDIDYSGGERV